MIHKERFLLIKAECYEIVITNTGTDLKKKRGQTMIDMKEIEFLIEGDTAHETIVSMKSSARFLIKQNFYEIKDKYDIYIDKMSQLFDKGMVTFIIGYI